MKKIILFVLIIFSFLSCQNKNKERKEAILKIGIITPLTGDVATWGAMQKRATDLAIKQLNNKRIKVIYEDTKAEPKSGVNATNKLIDINKVDILVGSPASSVTLAIAPICNKNKIVVLSSGSTATEVGKAGPYIFRIMPSDEYQSVIVSKWVKDLNIKNIAILYVQNSWGEGLKNTFTIDFKDQEHFIQITESVKPKTTDFKTIIEKIKNKKVDAIFAPLYPNEAGLFVKQLKELDLKIPVFGADVYDTPEFINIAGNAAIGVRYTTFGKYQGKEFQYFNKLYKEKYGIDAETYAAYCYDAFMIASNVLLDNTNKDTREKLLKIKDYNGVTGVTSFNGNNSATGKTFDRIIITEELKAEKQ